MITMLIIGAVTCSFLCMFSEACQTMVEQSAKDAVGGVGEVRLTIVINHGLQDIDF